MRGDPGSREDAKRVHLHILKKGQEVEKVIA